MSPLWLSLRTPHGLLVDREVDALSAEDEAGWFGVLPGRQDLIACLPAGLLTFRARDGEHFVAHASGLLELHAGRCRVMLHEATLAASLAEVADALARARAVRRARSERRSGVLGDLEREALRRLAAEPKP